MNTEMEGAANAERAGPQMMTQYQSLQSSRSVDIALHDESGSTIEVISPWVFVTSSLDCNHSGNTLTQALSEFLCSPDFDLIRVRYFNDNGSEPKEETSKKTAPQALKNTDRALSEFSGMLTHQSRLSSSCEAPVKPLAATDLRKLAEARRREFEQLIEEHNEIVRSISNHTETVAAQSNIPAVTAPHSEDCST
ncbi:hypothetical protein Ciccas_008144 [Cichlidogyrus casuarinus]|uniref:Uncharacterized protein n=1 Tax=Cichlidogyrus casuarinus TaxID=1844966 RepID=A0ABD2Q216_9PLAT